MTTHPRHSEMVYLRNAIYNDIKDLSSNISRSINVNNRRSNVVEDYNRCMDNISDTSTKRRGVREIFTRRGVRHHDDMCAAIKVGIESANDDLDDLSQSTVQIISDIHHNIELLTQIVYDEQYLNPDGDWELANNNGK